MTSKRIRATGRHLLAVGQGLESLAEVAHHAPDTITGEALRNVVTHMTANMLREMNAAMREIGSSVVFGEHDG